MEKTKHSKWELARYLIDAKKCVDSIQYASENMQHLANLGMREQINEKRRQFYINCGVIIDKAYDKNQKKALKNNEPLIESILYERDKNQAHKGRGGYRLCKGGWLAHRSEPLYAYHLPHQSRKRRAYYEPCGIERASGKILPADRPSPP